MSSIIQTLRHDLRYAVRLLRLFLPPAAPDGRPRAATGLAFLVRDLSIEFLKAAMLDDELSVTVEVKERRAASILFGQTISRADGMALIRAQVRVACVDLERMRPAQIPSGLIPGLPPIK